MTEENMLTATNIKYLIAIYELNEVGKFVKCTDIAKKLSVTRPSVHAMIKTLSEIELIEKPHYGKVSFNDSGRALACIYIKSYKVIYEFFRDLFPPQSDIENAVYAFMSQIPVGTLDKVCRNIKEKQLILKSDEFEIGCA